MKLFQGEFVREIKAPICPKRLKLINDVFNKLDFNKDGVIKIEDLRHWYGNSAKSHPKYIKGEWTVEQVRLDFLIVNKNIINIFFKGFRTEFELL